MLNYFTISQNIRDIYNKKGNENVAILWMREGGHASDFYFPGYYNQIFLLLHGKVFVSLSLNLRKLKESPLIAHLLLVLKQITNCYRKAFKY